MNTEMYKVDDRNNCSNGGGEPYAREKDACEDNPSTEQEVQDRVMDWFHHSSLLELWSQKQRTPQSESGSDWKHHEDEVCQAASESEFGREFCRREPLLRTSPMDYMVKNKHSKVKSIFGHLASR